MTAPQGKGMTISELVDAGNAQIQLSAQAAADAIVARRMWTAVADLLPRLNLRLHAVTGEGCEAGARRSYLRGQYDLLTHDLWEALQLPIPPEFAKIAASGEGGGETMTEPDELATDDAQAGADAAAEADAEETAEADTENEGE